MKYSQVVHHKNDICIKLYQIVVYIIHKTGAVHGAG